MRLLLLLAMTLLSSSVVGRIPRPAFAYSEGRRITIADAGGRTITTFRAPAPVEDFSVDASADHLVLATREGEYGGELLWCTVSQQSCTVLSHGPYYFKNDATTKEVYADPSLSPNARWVAFAIHSQYRNALRAKEEDIVEASGPIALIGTNGVGARVLKSTLDREQGGPFLANSPQWSPNGRRILFSFEVSGGVTDTAGRDLFHLSAAMEGSRKDSWTRPLAWLGNDSILFARARGSKLTDVRNSEVLRLDLSDMRVQTVDHIGGVPARDLRGALSLELSANLVAVQTWPSDRVYNRATGSLVWKTETAGSVVHLISP